MVKFSLYSKLLCVISTLYCRGKLSEHLILIVVTLPLNILLSWAFVNSLNCSVMTASRHDDFSVVFVVLLAFIAGYC